MLDARAREARTLFAGIAPRYAWPAELLSFGQYGRWRRALVRSIAPATGATVLDVATGTGLIARDVARRWGSTVIGLDQSEPMLARGSGPRIAADARALPFRDGAFEIVTFSYLLRYVDDVEATLRELIRVLRPGGTLGSVEFGVPASAIARAGWLAYTRTLFRWATAAFGRGWRVVGAFLGPSITSFARAWPLERQVRAWEDLGVQVTTARRMSLGAGVVMIGRAS